MGSKCALQKFDDDLSNANLMNQIKYSTACAKYINGELNCQLMSGMARICHDISNRDYDITSFGNAYMKAIFREGQLQKEDLDRLIMNIDKLNEDYQTMNETVSSKHYSFYTDNIERKIENVDRMKDVLLDALQAIIENPKESNLRKYLKNVAEVWCDQVKALRNSLVVEPGLFTTQELLNNTSKLKFFYIFKNFFFFFFFFLKKKIKNNLLKLLLIKIIIINIYIFINFINYY